MRSHHYHFVSNTMKGTAFLVFALVAVVVAERSCPPAQEHDWTIEKLLRHEHCDKFYKCTFGVPVEKLCPEDLWFNLDKWQCDWSENVECGDRVVPGTTFPPPPPTTTTTTPPPPPPPPPTTTPTPDPDTLPNGCPVDGTVHRLLPHETNCSHFYYCVWGRRVLRQCPTGTYFNRRLQVCDHEWRNFDCRD